MELNNIPVEIISKCNTVGDIVPLRMRIENEDHQLVVATITDILYSTENNSAGLKTFDYGCKVLFDETERLLELRYSIASHKWSIRKVVY